MLSLQVVDRAGEAHQVAGWEAPDGALYFDLVLQVMSLLLQVMSPHYS